MKPAVAGLCVRLILALGLSAAPVIAETGPTTLPADYRGLQTTNTYRLVDAPTAESTIRVGPISPELRRDFEIDPFYAKTLSVRGIPIIASVRVSDYALLECAYTLDHILMKSPPEVIKALRASKVRMGIIAVVEYTMDIPEDRQQATTPIDAAFQDRRSRGLGGLPLATCAEENLLNLNGDPYVRENITIHEFSHTIADAMQAADPAWYRELRLTYEQAMADGLFAHSYSATNEQEYWAEGAQAWFDCASPIKDADVHSGIWNRTQLRDYDPRLARLLETVYGDGAWRYVKTTNQPVVAEAHTYRRIPEELTHLDNLDRSLFPTFSFENSPRVRRVARAEGSN